jgi:hypothetical protein
MRPRAAFAIQLCVVDTNCSALSQQLVRDARYRIASMQATNADIIADFFYKHIPSVRFYLSRGLERIAPKIVFPPCYRNLLRNGVSIETQRMRQCPLFHDHLTSAPRSHGVMRPPLVVCLGLKLDDHSCAGTNGQSVVKVGAPTPRQMIIQPLRPVKSAGMAVPT